MQKNEKGEFIGQRSHEQLDRDNKFKENAISLIQNSGENWSLNSLAALKRNAISRILYYDQIYNEIIDIPGVIMEFGVHWGSGTSVLHNLRLLHEPYNFSRKIIGFDTFEGFTGTDTDKDGSDVKDGDFNLSNASGLDKLTEMLDYHRSISPFPEKKTYELVQGDACTTIQKWLNENPYALVSMAIFDMDIYKPTKEVLEAIQSRLTTGSILVFDELNCEYFPGETVAFLESELRDVVKLKRHPLMPYCAWGKVTLGN